MTPSDFKTRHPEFDSEADGRVQFFIDRADPYFDVERWGHFYTDGLCFWIAHEITSANRAATSGGAASSGIVQSESVGDVSVTYAVSTASTGAQDQNYSTTSYGQRYLQLMRLVSGGALAV